MIYNSSTAICNLIFIHFGNSTILTGVKYNPVKYFTSNKPSNALWACPYITDKTYKSDWEEYCINNKMESRVSDYTLFRLKTDSKILILNSFDDLLSIDNKYINKDLLSNTSLITENILNIENIESDFDGIYITKRCLKECSNIFYKWEVESLCLFTSDIIVKLFKENF